MNLFVQVSRLGISLVLTVCVDILMEAMLEGKVDWGRTNVARLV